MKRFITKILYTVFPVWLFFVGITIYYNLFYAKEMTGDIGRLGKIAFGTEYNQIMKKNYLKDTLYIKIENNQTLHQQKLDILVTGDSFARLGLFSFQNYIAEKGYSVGNYDGKHSNPFQTGWDLLQFNLIDSLHVKSLLIETVEREFIMRIQKLSFNDKNMAFPALQLPPTISQPDLLLEAKNWLLLKLGLNQSINYAELKQDLFSHKKARKLYFYNVDITSEMEIPQEKGEMIKTKLNKLFAKSEEKGIKLYILIAADKYDIYQPFIKNNPYPTKTINEDLKALMPDANIIFSKTILQPLLYQGEKDIYQINDTHWSYKSSQILANEIIKKLEKGYGKQQSTIF